MFDTTIRCHRPAKQTDRGPELLQRTTAMTIEIFYLTAQIHRWLNVRIARHLEAQAARLAR
jgi:hypothetical protein